MFCVSELRPPTCLLLTPGDECAEPWWNDADRGNQRTRRNTCPSATLSTTNPTCDSGANPSLQGDRRLRTGTILNLYRSELSVSRSARLIPGETLASFRRGTRRVQTSILSLRTTPRPEGRKNVRPYVPLVLSLGRWRSVLSFTLRSPYRRYPL
jgi:hypothetical protein